MLAHKWEGSVAGCRRGSVDPVGLIQAPPRTSANYVHFYPFCGGTESRIVGKYIGFWGSFPCATMKMVAEYLERAHQFERLAAREADPKLKADFEKQAKAYQDLAGKRARELGLPLPTDKNS